MFKFNYKYACIENNVHLLTPIVSRKLVNKINNKQIHQTNLYCYVMLVFYLVLLGCFIGVTSQKTI